MRIEISDQMAATLETIKEDADKTNTTTFARIHLLHKLRKHQKETETCIRNTQSS